MDALTTTITVALTGDIAKAFKALERHTRWNEYHKAYHKKKMVEDPEYRAMIKKSNDASRIKYNLKKKAQKNATAAVAISE